MSASDSRILPYCEPSSKDEFYAYAGVVGSTYAPHKESKLYSASVKALLDTLLRDANTPFAAFDGVIKALTDVNNQMLAEIKKVEDATKSKSKAPRLNLREGGADVDDQEAESDEEADKGGEILDEQKLEELAKQEQVEKEKELKVAAAIRKKNEEDERRRLENEEILQSKMRKEIDNDISKNAAFAPLKRDDDELDSWSAPKGKGKGKGKK